MFIETALLRTLLSAVFIVLMLMVIFTVPSVRKFTTRNIASLMIWTYFCGFAIYLWGFWYGASTNILTASMRAAISSLEMFASHSDLIEVNEELKEENMFYMLAFSLIHFQALILSLTFILDIFGKRLVSKLNIKRLIATGKDKKLFLFDGATDDTIAFARSIPQSKDNVIVFIRSIVDPDVKEFSIMEALVRGFNKKGAVDECENIGSVLYTSVPLAVAARDANDGLLKNCIKLISSHGKSDVYMVSWDSHMNAEAAFDLSNALPDGLEARIFAGVNVTKPHADKLDGCKYVIKANRSKAVVDHLFNSTPLLTEGNGKHTLILGFGHTARNCMRRLTEQGFRRMDIVDPATAKHSAEYLCFHPEIEKMEGIRFYPYSTKDNSFWKYLKENITDISNVVILGHDDEANFENAVTISKYASMMKKDMSDFRVCMMVSSDRADHHVEHVYPFGTRDAICDCSLF